MDKEASIDNISKDIEKKLNTLRSTFKAKFSLVPRSESYWFLIRFLRARNMNVAKTIKLLNNFFSFFEKTPIKHLE